MTRLGRFTSLALVGLVSLLLTTPAAANTSAPARVIPPSAHPFGASYGEWSAGWWEWALSLPATDHPLLQSGAVDCAAGQSGPVWFIGGSFAPGRTMRSCTIPKGTAVFFPILNNASLALPEDADTPRLLRRHAREIVNAATGIFARVDGQKVTRLARFRADSPLFFVRQGPDNLFGVPDGTLVRGVSDGYWLMLTPLKPGVHRLRFGGALEGFSLDVSYRITVSG